MTCAAKLQLLTLTYRQIAVNLHEIEVSTETQRHND